MAAKTWLYDAILYIYALSLLFYFSDVAAANRSAKRMGTGLLAFVWLLETVFIVYRFASGRHTPVLTLFETLFFYAWLLVTISFTLNWFLRIDLIVFLVNVAGFAILALNFFSDPDAVPLSDQWEARDELLFIHVTLAIASYAAFLIAAIFSGMYLFLHGQLKGKQWSSLLVRFPSLENIESYTFRAVLIGTPLFILSVALGIVIMTLSGEDRFFTDPKVASTALMIAAYAFYIVQRLRAKHPGFRLAAWNLAAFATVVINFLLSNWLSRFHQWIWM